MTDVPTIYLATGSTHKVAEITQMLEGYGLPVRVESAKGLGGMPKVEEDGNTFLDNARLKANALTGKLPEGSWVLADDSGLVVDVLGGAPGIISARYAGVGSTDRQNNDKLMDDLAMVPRTRRTARFVCCFVLIDRDGNEAVFNGECKGTIVNYERGGKGFGYDPLFQPDGYEETFGQLGSDVKNTISHRSKAVKGLAQWLKEYLNSH